jgi:hypothetical protein
MDIFNNYYSKSFEGINIVYQDYWDFNLVTDKNGVNISYATNCKDSCEYNIISDGLVVWFDINNSGTTLNGDKLVSLIEWTGTTIEPNTGFTLNDWGLTSVDNGKSTCLSGETLTITSADTKLTLYPVSGYTISYSQTGCTTTNSNYEYPWYFLTGTTTLDGCIVGDTICLNGGFYQGFFKLDTDRPAPIQVPNVDECGVTGYTLTAITSNTFYQLMPIEFPLGWSMETWVKNDNTNCPTTANTLNILYPNNKNFFFYIGTRSENKFWNDFSGETGLVTTTGIPLSRTESSDYESNIITGGQNWFSISNPNPMGFSNSNCCLCYTACTDTTVTTGKTYSYCDQYSENALGFRITEDGRIGYRKLTVTGDCFNNKFKITGTTIEEGYSEPGVIPSGNTWNHITVTYTQGNGIKNTLPTGTLKFWVNGKVVYRVKDFIGLKLRSLDEWSDKQIGVPFNLSWGGGTQGLLESQTFNGVDYDDKNLLIQENFAGTFDGELSQLRFYEKPLNVLEVRNNFFIDCKRYCKPDTFGGSQIIQPDNNTCGDCKKGLIPIFNYTPCDI